MFVCGFLEEWCEVVEVVEFLVPSFRVAVISEVFVPVVVIGLLLCCFDGAPVAFCTCGDLLRVSHESVGVATVEAVYFLDRVEVAEVFPVIVEVG